MINEIRGNAVELKADVSSLSYVAAFNETLINRASRVATAR
jgi:hypothetical protein